MGSRGCVRGGLAEGLQSAHDLPALLRAQHVGEPVYLARVRCEDLFDQAAPRCREIDDTNAAILQAVRAGNEPALQQAIDCDGDRARREKNLRPNGIYGHWALVQQSLQDTKLGLAEPAVFQCVFGEAEQGVVRLDEHQPKLCARHLVGLFTLAVPLSL